MKCKKPITVKIRGEPQKVACGQCQDCRIGNVQDWGFRLAQELKECKNAYFITLTYADGNPDFTGKCEKSHMRAFLRQLDNRIRYNTRRMEKVPENERQMPKTKYFAVGEYGEQNNRPHYHLLIFNLPIFTDDFIKFKTSKTEVHRAVFEAWGKGFVSVGDVNSKTINYVCKYMFKQDKIKGTFRWMSKKIGANYISDAMLVYHQEDEKFYVTKENGLKQRLPMYYNRKLFDDANRANNREKILERFEEERQVIESQNAEQNIADLRKRLASEDQKFKNLKVNIKRKHETL